MPLSHIPSHNQPSFFFVEEVPEMWLRPLCLPGSNCACWAIPPAPISQVLQWDSFWTNSTKGKQRKYCITYKSLLCSVWKISTAKYTRRLKIFSTSCARWYLAYYTENTYVTSFVISRENNKMDLRKERQSSAVPHVNRIVINDAASVKHIQ